MKNKKIIILLGFIAFILISYLFVIYATNIPELIDKQQPEPRIDWCDNPNDLECISQNAQIIHNEREICEKVIKDSYSYFLEDVERCRDVLGLR